MNEFNISRIEKVLDFCDYVFDFLIGISQILGAIFLDIDTQYGLLLKCILLLFGIIYLEKLAFQLIISNFKVKIIKKVKEIIRNENNFPHNRTMIELENLFPNFQNNNESQIHHYRQIIISFIFFILHLICSNY